MLLHIKNIIYKIHVKVDSHYTARTVTFRQRHVPAPARQNMKTCVLNETVHTIRHGPSRSGNGTYRHRPT